MRPPGTQFTLVGDDRIAYQEWGNGDIAAVLVYGFYSHIELNWETPALARLFARLETSMRVVQFDRRGCGLSDRPDRPLTLADRVDDVLAVMDATGCGHAALVGQADGAATSIMVAAAHPDRVSHLVLYAPVVRMLRSEDFPWGVVHNAADVERFVETTVASWGEPQAVGRMSADASDANQELISRYQRMAISPKGFRDMLMSSVDVDIRSILPTLSTPTLILHKPADPVVNVGQGRYLREHVPGARLIELPGASHLIADDDTYTLVDAITTFLTGLSPVEPHDRVLATVLFTDMVASTHSAHSRGDHRWLDVLDDHGELVRRIVGNHRGRLVKWTGDGALATFDGPARAVPAGQEIVRGVRRLGLEARAGVHTGEIEVREDDIGGIAVHIGARVAELAQPNQVLVSRVVVELVAGSNIGFTEIGDHHLRGVPGTWSLFEVDTIPTAH